MPAGKIVDHFLFKRQGKTLQVPVRLHKTSERHDGAGSSRYAGPQQTREVVFGVDIEQPKVCLWSTDIEALRAAVMDALADHYKIKWKEYWVVTVEEAYRTWDENGAGVGLSWHLVVVGTTPDGEMVHRSDRYGATSGSDITKGWPKLNEGRRGQERTEALIEATDVNTKALEDFSKRLVELRKRLREFLSPEKIAANLAQLTGLIAPQLPAPKDAKVVEACVVHEPKISKRRPGKKGPAAVRAPKRKARKVAPKD